MSVGVTAVRRAAQQVLRDHLAAALTAEEAQEGLAAGSLPMPRSWVRIADFTTLAMEDSPAIFVTSPGMVDQPAKTYELIYSGAWHLWVTVVVRARSFDETADHVGYYVEAARNAILAHGQLGGLASSTNLAGEEYDVLAAEQGRTIGAGRAGFTVHVEGVADGTLAP